MSGSLSHGQLMFWNYSAMC